MKTIKNSKSIRVYTFACALILIILLSSIIGTIAAKKPDKPSSETWDIKIWIGLKDSNGNPIEDIVLMTPEYLFVEDVPSSGVGGGLWDQPMKKGNRPNKNNYLAAQVNLYKDDGDDCGTYQLPASLDDFPLENDDIVHVGIRHHVWPVGEGMDYWTFVIRWVLNPDPYEYEFYGLSVWTNKDYEPEGTLSDEEVWTVPFNEADAMLYPTMIDDDGDGIPDVVDWTGSLSFTIIITRSPHVA